MPTIAGRHGICLSAGIRGADAEARRRHIVVLGDVRDPRARGAPAGAWPGRRRRGAAGADEGAGGAGGRSPSTGHSVGAVCRRPGLQAGDLLLEVGGEPSFAAAARSTNCVAGSFASCAPTPAPYTVVTWRDGRRVESNVRLALGPVRRNRNPPRPNGEPACAPTRPAPISARSH